MAAVIDTHRVAGIVSALIPRDTVVALRKDINDFTLSFVAPLDAYNCEVLFHYRCLSRALVITPLSTAPTICSLTWPSLMTRRVGMPRTLKRAAVEPFASTSSLPTLTRPLYSSAIASTVGAIARHGAHQAAQKSTKTGVLDFTTSDSKLESVISIVLAPMNPPKKFYTNTSILGGNTAAASGYLRNDVGTDVGDRLQPVAVG